MQTRLSCCDDTVRSQMRLWNEDAPGDGDYYVPEVVAASEGAVAAKNEIKDQIMNRYFGNYGEGTEREGS